MSHCYHTQLDFTREKVTVHAVCCILLDEKSAEPSQRIDSAAHLYSYNPSSSTHALHDDLHQNHHPGLCEVRCIFKRSKYPHGSARCAELIIICPMPPSVFLHLCVELKRPHLCHRVIHIIERIQEDMLLFDQNPPPSRFVFPHNLSTAYRSSQAAPTALRSIVVISGFSNTLCWNSST